MAPTSWSELSAGKFSVLFFFPFFFFSPDRGAAAWQWKSTEAKSVLFFLCPAQLRYSGTYKATLLKRTVDRKPIARSEMSVFLDLWFAGKTKTNDNRQVLSIAICSTRRKWLHSQIQKINMSLPAIQNVYLVLSLGHNLLLPKEHHCTAWFTM